MKITRIRQCCLWREAKKIEHVEWMWRRW